MCLNSGCQRLGQGRVRWGGRERNYEGRALDRVCVVTDGLYLDCGCDYMNPHKQKNSTELETHAKIESVHKTLRKSQQSL